MKITQDLAELIGVIIGDGNIHYNKKTRKYYLEITGNPKKEKGYFNYISLLFKKVINKPGTIRIANNGLRLRIYSKQFIEFLIFELGLHYNKNKSNKVIIPQKITKSKRLTYFCLKGIFDTDGSFFLANKGYRKDYPSVEISTCSTNLAKQIKEIMEKEFRIKFRTQKRETYTYGKRYILSLNGEKEIEKWFDKIGSSNNNKLKKYQNFLITKDLNNKSKYSKSTGR